MVMEAPLTAASQDALQGLAYRPGYDHALRVEGLQYLLDVDREAVVTVLRRRLPRVRDHAWLTKLCDFVAAAQLMELDEALVSSWGRPWTGELSELDRPEAKALAALHGQDAVESIVWRVFKSATRPSQRGLRYRCWDLLHRLGAREALVELVVSAGGADRAHPMTASLHAAAEAFGTVPWNREEMLWIEKLADPQRRDFWQIAAEATSQLPADRRAQLEVRDLPVLAAAAEHRPELLGSSTDALYDDVRRSLEGTKHFSEQDPGYMPGGAPDHELSAHRDRLTWGDLVALRMAQEAMGHDAVRAHLFHYADRDHADETTEYGGVLALDDDGRFEVLEFPPRVRVHDRRFEASQEMFDAGYTGLYHFHFHAQKTRNGQHAGPGAGDMKYADATRANCLVLTSIDEDTMNVDYYRHGGVLVDLGVVVRPRTAMFHDRE